jgi:hypothetical protein
MTNINDEHAFQRPILLYLQTGMLIMYHAQDAIPSLNLISFCLNCLHEKTNKDVGNKYWLVVINIRERTWSPHNSSSYRYLWACCVKTALELMICGMQLIRLLRLGSAACRIMHAVNVFMSKNSSGSTSD